MSGELAALPAEPWGWRMKRARECHAHLTGDQAVAEIGRYFLTSAGSISRLEKSPDVPKSRSQRQLACVALVVYGIDPEPFGLGRIDLPPAIYAQLKRRRPSFGLLVGNRRNAPVTERYPQLSGAAA